MTDVEERLQRALRIIADDVAIPDELDLVRDQLTARPLVEPTVELDERRHRWTFLVAAAAVVAGVAALATLLWWRDATRPAPATPTPSTISIDDPMGIDLDAWAGPESQAPGPFLVFDVEQLPAGWTVTSPPAGWHPVGDPDPSHYTWNAALRDGDGREVYVMVTNPAWPGPEGGTPVDVAGHDAVIKDDAVTWLDPLGRGLTVNSLGASSSELVAIAERLTTTTSDALPAPPDAAPPVVEPAAVPRLAGRIDGVAWAINSADVATTDLTLEVGGQGRGGYEGMRRPVVDTWDVHLAGLGAHGTLLYGLAPADVTTVRVVTDDVTVTMPVVHDANGVAIWALPVPPGLAPRELQLLAATGTPLNRVRLPAFLAPAAGGGSSQERPLDGSFPTTS